MPEELAVAVVPGVEALVETRRGFRIHAGRLGSAIDQFRVEQPPPQPLGQIVRKLSPARTVLALHSNHSYRRMTHVCR